MMSDGRMISPSNTFEGWNLYDYIKGFKKPAIFLLGVGLVWLIAQPGWEWLLAAGLSAERLWALIEFYSKRVILK